MRHGSLFSGIGGFDLASEWMGWENVFHCEWNEFGQKILKHYWPGAETFTDITKSDFRKYANTIDILRGGFPCQPYSQAGKRKGKEDERHLWPEMLRAIREIQPRWVVGENVLGLVNWSGGLVFHEVQTDLEAAGYEVWPYVLPACAKDAPHRRDRVWFVAYAYGKREEQREQKRPGLRDQSFTRTTTNAHSDGQLRGNGKHEKYTSEGGQYAQRDFEQMGGNVTNTGGKGLQRREDKRTIGSIRQDREKQSYGFLPPTWEGFPTQSPLCNGDDGISPGLDTTTISFSKWRNESIKAGGNAIVPQVVYEIFKAIESYEKLTA